MYNSSNNNKHKKDCNDRIVKELEKYIDDRGHILHLIIGIKFILYTISIFILHKDYKEIIIHTLFGILGAVTNFLEYFKILDS